MSLRVTPIHRALHRPNLVLGCEREPALAVLLACAVLGLLSRSPAGAGACAGLALAALAGLRLAARSDPLMSRVYLRALRYRSPRPWRSTPWRRDGAGAP